MQYRTFQTVPTAANGGGAIAIPAGMNAAAMAAAANAQHQQQNGGLPVAPMGPNAGGGGGRVPMPIGPTPIPTPVLPPSGGGGNANTNDHWMPNGCRERWSSGGCASGQYVPTNVPGQFRNPCTGEVRSILPPIEVPAAAAVASVGKAQEEQWVLMKRVKKATGVAASGSSCGVQGGGIQPCQAKRCCTSKHHTICYQTEKKRANCYPADHQEYDVAYNITAFISEFKLGPLDTDEWNDFTNGSDFQANDGQVFANKKGLTLLAKVFSVTYPPLNVDVSGVPHPNGFLDHFKRWVIRNSDYQVESCGQILVEACMAARVFGNDDQAAVALTAASGVPQQPINGAAVDTFGSAINDAKSDLRFGYAAVTMTDFSSGLHAAVAVTDKAYWAIYEMLPFDQEDGVAENGSRASFAAAFYMGGRNAVRPHDDFARVGIAYDKAKGLTWYLDGVAVHNEPRPGYPPRPDNILYMVPGESRRADVECLRFGLGLFTMMDALPMETDRISPSQQQALVRLTPATYVHPMRPGRPVSFASNERSPPEMRLPGTGVMTNVKSFKIAYRC